MIAPGSIADRALFACMLGSLSALAVATHRWVLQEPPEPERVRSHLMAVPTHPPNRVSA